MMAISASMILVLMTLVYIATLTKANVAEVQITQMKQLRESGTTQMGVVY
jgi:hypothetical protein